MDPAYELWLEDTLELVSMVNEGGSIEVDGRRTVMAKESSILSPNRNPGMTKSEAESIFRQYFGVTNFIWLEGKIGADITDDHIDGTARFANGETIVTYIRDFFVNTRHDFLDVIEDDVLAGATDVDGNPYQMVHLPLTANPIPGIHMCGYYQNYYVGNDVVIVPNFLDPNDDDAKDISRQLYPAKTMVQIDFRELYEDDGWSIVLPCRNHQIPRKTNAIPSKRHSRASIAQIQSN